MAWRLAQSPSVERLYASPGNPGISRVAECVSASAATPAGYLAVAAAVGADLTVVGPETPLTEGIVDVFRERRKRIVGPSRAAAQLEGSKIFAKEFMVRAGIPTARFLAADCEADARKTLSDFSYPVVLKADGLAAGKGVVIAENKAHAESILTSMFSGELVGKAGSRVVVEEFLQGEEVSFIVLSDGRGAIPLEPTQDHKAVLDGDRGPNTGGMGAYCDSRILTPAESDQVMRTVIQPAIATMAADGTPFTGFLYAGLMMTDRGPQVLEFNVRLGDPETQALMHRLRGDLAEALDAAASGELGEATLDWHYQPSVCVVLAAAGYPGRVRTGDRIAGIGEAEALGATVFQAGTRIGQNGLETAGGRVLGVTASGESLAAAIRNVYQAVGSIRFDGMHHRMDIGQKGLKRW